MTTVTRLRFFHAGLAILAATAYASGEVGIIHSWLGYGVAGFILLRLLWAAAGAPQLGLSKFYPDFDGLHLGNLSTHPAISRTLLGGIALCLLGVTATGIWMDKGRSVGIRSPVSAAIQLDHEGEADHEAVEGEGDHGEEAAEEIHEAFANALLAFVALHVLYLFAFKRPLALFMLYLKAPRQRRVR